MLQKKKNHPYIFSAYPFRVAGVGGAYPKNSSSYKIKTKLAHNKMFSLILNVPVRVT